MKINLADIFCEVLSGLALFLNIIPLLDILDLATISKSLTYVSSKMTLSNVTVFVVACYVLGLLIDAVGLAFDRIFSFVLEDKSPPSYTQRSNYWKSVTPQVLAGNVCQLV